MQSQAITSVFQFQSHKVRIVTRNNEPWFVAADVCKVLDIGNVTMALKRLDTDEQALSTIEGLSRGNDNVNIINESGLYSLIFRSRKPEALKFTKWVTSEVLPTIRKTGQYSEKYDDVERPNPLPSIKQEFMTMLFLFDELQIDWCIYAQKKLINETVGICSKRLGEALSNQHMSNSMRSEIVAS